MGEEYISLSSSICSFLYSPVTSSLLGPNILLNTLLSNTHSLRSSFNISDQVSHPYKTADKIIVLYILIFVSLGSYLEDKRFCTEWYQAFPDFSTANINTYSQDTCLPGCFAVETSDFVFATFPIWRYYRTEDSPYLYSNNDTVSWYALYKWCSWHFHTFKTILILKLAFWNSIIKKENIFEFPRLTPGDLPRTKRSKRTTIWKTLLYTNLNDGLSQKAGVLK